MKKLINAVDDILAESLTGFDTKDICLDQVQVEEFAGFIYANLDPDARPLREVSGNLETEIRHWAPDIENLTFGHRPLGVRDHPQQGDGQYHAYDAGEDHF